MKKNILKIFCLILVSSTVCSFDRIIPTTYAEDTTILRADNYIWKYKFINGNRYKRKFNTSTQTYIGKWIKA